MFAAADLQHILGPDVTLISTGEPVARQTRRLLEAASLMASAPQNHSEAQEYKHTQLLTSGSLTALQAAALRWLQMPAQACAEAVALR